MEKLASRKEKPASRRPKSQQVVGRKPSKSNGKVSKSWTSCPYTGSLALMKDTHTPCRSIRVPDRVWEKAKAEAERRGETVTDAINRFLERYGRP